MSTVIHQRVESARQGGNPYVICRMPSGWAVLGDYQFIRGYALLLPDPVVPDLNHLTMPARAQYLSDMVLIGDALLACTDSHRINYSILGNTDAALHAHIFPRYMNEPERYRVGPVWHYPPEQRTSGRFSSSEHGELQEALRAFIQAQLDA